MWGSLLLWFQKPTGGLEMYPLGIKGRLLYHLKELDSFKESNLGVF